MRSLGVPLAAAVLVAASATATPMFAQATNPSFTDVLSFGAIADLHYADRDATGSRFYRASLDKTGFFASTMNGLAPDFVIQLGDFKDQDPTPNKANTIQYLQDVEAEFQKFNGPTYHVLGNHDMDSISKSEFLANVEITGGTPSGQAFYSWQTNGIHNVVLDPNFRADGVAYDSGNFDWTDANVPQSQLDWLAADLASNDLPTLVYSHQPLMIPESLSTNVNNGDEVRQVLEADGDVMAAFSGHNHGGGYQQINGIHHLTLEGAVGNGENPISDNAFSLVTVSQNNEDPEQYQIHLQGFGVQGSRTMLFGGEPLPSEPTELLAYYAFDTDTGLTDGSGNSNDGVGGFQDSSDPSDPTFGVPGVVTGNTKLGDGALRLQEAGATDVFTSVPDVSGQWVDVNSVLDDIETGDDVSFSLWFNASRGDYSASVWNDLLIGANTRDRGNLFRVGINPNDGSIHIPGVGDSVETGFNDQLWHHLVVVTDGDTGDFTVYMDGEPLTGFGGDLVDWDAAGNLSIGMEFDPDGPGDFFDGWIDDFAIWKGQLTAEEVAFFYNEGAGRTVPEPASAFLFTLASAALLRRRRRPSPEFAT
jgi:alkaline phosphatase